MRRVKKVRARKAFYDREEGIAWGPRGLEEIIDDVKDDFQRPQISKPERRHTLQCSFEPETNQITKNIPNKMDHFNTIEHSKQPTEDASIPEISAYLTASEVTNNKNENSMSEYVSAVDNLSNGSAKSCNGSSNLSSCAGNNEAENKYNVKDTSHLNFLKKFMDRPSDNIFETEQEAFAESAVFSPDPINQNNSNSIIEISSDDEEFEGSMDLSCVHEISDENIHNTSGFSNKNCSRKEMVEEVKSYCKATENSGADISTIDYSSCHISPAISIPEIDLHQFNESSDCPLDDTIERINALLKQGEDISITEGSDQGDVDLSDDIKRSSYDVDEITDKINKKETFKDNYYYSSVPSTSDDFVQPCNLISGSFLQKPMSELCAKNTPMKYHTPIKTPMSGIPVFKKNPESFRIPYLPSKSKSNQKLPKTNFKDVVSPVGMYIKYSPRPILQRKPTSADKKISKLNVSPSKESKDKENSITFPNVIYKPSTKQIIASEKIINLPPSIEKLVINSNIIKHDKKLVSKSLFRRDESLNTEGELTKNSLSDSQFSEVDQNVSVLHKKTPFRN